ncbi:SHIRT domain-containing protein, partial [Anaerofustis sp.]|uniref:SHIRT domain-containing protein n=1 Tax=Anaerofustis sp. TaxID=1872517 RepID=UPI0025C24A06
AGGIKAAQNAEYQQLYIPSTYMKDGLVIGKSQANDQLNYMTYVQKEKYPVIYEFVNGTNKQKLPKEVTDLLPVDDNKYIEGATIDAIQPNKTAVTVSDGMWVFKGYDANSKLSSVDNLNNEGYIQFIGTWEFKENENM